MPAASGGVTAAASSAIGGEASKTGGRLGGERAGGPVGDETSGKAARLELEGHSGGGPASEAAPGLAAVASSDAASTSNDASREAAASGRPDGDSTGSGEASREAVRLGIKGDGDVEAGSRPDGEVDGGTFCYTFHWMNSGGVDVVLVMRIVVIVVCLICLFIIVGIIGAGLKNAICPKRANKAEKQVKQVFGRRSDALLYFLARAPLFTLTFSFFWLIATPIFYFFVFLPCWDCFDFKATIAHEVGHVLGFDHPDQFPSLNLRAKDGVNIGASDTCTKPLQADFIELSPLPAGSDTIMYSQTKHRSRTCLTADDVEGLNFLYPSCDDDVGGAPMAEPKCLEALELSGYLRVTLALGGPFVLAAILMAMVQCCVSCYMARRSKNYEQAVSRLRRDASGLRKEAESLRLSLRAMEERQSAGEQPAEKTKSSKIWSALAGRSSRNMMGLFTPRHGKRGGGDTSGGASGTITGNDLLNSSDSEEEMQREVERMSAVRESVREATSSRRDSQRLMV